MRWTINYVATLVIVVFATAGLVLAQLGLLPSIGAWTALLVTSAVAVSGASLLLARAPQPKLVLAREGLNIRLANSRAHAGSRPGWGALLAVLPWLLLIPGFAAMFLSTRMQLAAHGYVHSAYVYQILNNHIPPENVLFPGYPANYYWPYHALLAAISRLLIVPPPLSNTLFSLLALALGLGLLYELVNTLLVWEQRPWVLTILAFFALFGANTMGFFHALARLSPGGQTLQASAAALFPQQLFGDTRLTNPLAKYLGFDGTPAGWLLYFFVLLVLVKALSGRARGRDLVLACLAVLAALALHATEGIFMVVAIPAALAATYLLAALLEGQLFSRAYHRQKVATLVGNLTGHWRRSLAAGALLGIVGLATLRFLLDASAGGSASFAIDLVSLHGLKSIFSMTYPLIPFFLIGTYYAIRSGDKRVIFLASLTIIGLAMGYALRLSNNEYKFIYCATIAMSTLCTVPLWNYVFRPDLAARRWARVLGLVMLGLMTLNILALGLSRLAQPWVTQDNFVANGIHIDSRTAVEGTPFPEVELDWVRDEDGRPLPSDLPYADIFMWVRSNTPTDAILVVPQTHKEKSSLLVLSERVPYVVLADWFNNTLPGYEQRGEWTDQLYSTAELDSKRQALDGIRSDLPERPKYLLYPTDSPPLPLEPGQLGLVPLYEGRHARLFEIDPAGSTAR